MRRRVFAAGSAAVAATLAVPSRPRAQAQPPGRVPARTVRIVVPFGPGGPTDVVARIISDAMAAKWSVPVVVDNRPGGGTLIGTGEVARAEPDGHTLGIVISAYTINPAVRRRMPFDTLRDLRGVTQIGEAHVVLVAHPTFLVNDVPGLVALAKARGEPFAYASPGIATGTHMAAELLQRVAEIKLLHVPYNGSSRAVIDVLANRVPLLFDVWHSVQQHVAEGNLKVLGVTNATRIPNAPQHPTIGEIYPGYEANSIFGIVTAGGTPDAVVQALSADLAAFIRSDAFRAKAEGLGMTPVGSTPAEFDGVVRREIAKWRETAERAGIQIE